MSYIFDLNDSKTYKKWHDDPANSLIIQSQIELLFDMLKPVPDNSILDIGCGIGINFAAYLEKGLNVTGIEPSPQMIEIASKKYGNKVEIYKGFGEDLPFEDNSFNYAAISTTLEFTESPEKTIEEACRVTKDKLFIGILNKYAVKNIERRIKGIFTESIYKKARFFAIWEINNIVKSLVGGVPITWRTVYQSSSEKGENIFKKDGIASILRKNPFGAFVGILVILKPSFRTTPLKLKYVTNSFT